LSVSNGMSKFREIEERMNKESFFVLHKEEGEHLVMLARVSDCKFLLSEVNRLNEALHNAQSESKMLSRELADYDRYYGG